MAMKRIEETTTSGNKKMNIQFLVLVSRKSFLISLLVIGKEMFMFTDLHFFHQHVVVVVVRCSID